jgi:ribosomal protein L11 methyltransferase
VLRIEVPVADAEVAADELWVAGASAVGEETHGHVVVLTADLDDCPPSLATWPHSTSEDDGAWWDGWRPFARAVVAGPFLVRPPWIEAASGERALELVIDAGRAFGTGAHPSTTLALRALAPLVSANTSVLDAGCGSGTLAIGAALLGARPVVAVDPDPAAAVAARANAARNGVDGAVDVVECSVAQAEGTFDVVVANLGAPLVFDLAPALRARTRVGGALVLSGTLDDHDARLRRAYPDVPVLARTEDDGWTCVVLGPGKV